jgi:hypothetical protein
MKPIFSLAVGAILAISAPWATADVKNFVQHEWHLFKSSTPKTLVNLANGWTRYDYENITFEHIDMGQVSWDAKTQTATEDGKVYLFQPEVVNYVLWRIYDDKGVEQSSLPAQYNSYEWTNSWTVSDLPPPVPEPEAWLMLALGLPLVFWRRARRRLANQVGSPLLA